MMHVLGPKRRVYFLTAREPRPWEAVVNERLRSGVRRWSNTQLIDWHGAGNKNLHWFVGDGIHLTAAGQQGYANLVRAALVQR
jgi:hypothetical protein